MKPIRLALIGCASHPGASVSREGGWEYHRAFQRYIRARARFLLVWLALLGTLTACGSDGVARPTAGDQVSPTLVAQADTPTTAASPTLVATLPVATATAPVATATAPAPAETDAPATDVPATVPPAPTLRVVATVAVPTTAPSATPVALTPTPQSIPRETPEATAGGDRIAFTTRRDGNEEIYLMNPDGTGLLNLTQHPARDYMADWSPDGSRLVFLSDRAGIEQLFVMNADGSDPQQIGDLPEAPSSPSWSADGTRIAFDLGSDIYVINVDGTGLTAVTDAPEIDTSPSWSSDGTRIAFTSIRNGSFEIYTVELASGAVTQLTNSPGGDLHPEWSRDGSRITFVSNRAGSQALYVMAADGSGETLLTAKTNDVQTTSWSPDGTRIVFDAFTPGQDQLYMINADGTGLQTLTDGTTFDGDADWSPATPGSVPGVDDSPPTADDPGALESGSGLIYLDPDGATIKLAQPDGIESEVIHQIQKRPEELVVALTADPTGEYLWYGLAQNPQDPAPMYSLVRDGQAAEITAFARPPRWSSDGTRIAAQTFAGSDEPTAAYTYDVVANRGSLLPFDGLPDWFPDGRRLVYVADDNVYAYDIATEASTPLTDLPNTEDETWTVREAHVLPDGEGIIFFGGRTRENGVPMLGASGNGQQWWHIPAGGGDPQPWSQPGGNAVGAYASAPDGTRVAMLEYAHGNGCFNSATLAVGDAVARPGAMTLVDIPAQVLELEEYVAIQGLDWTPDSSQLVYGMRPYSCQGASPVPTRVEPAIVIADLENPSGPNGIMPRGFLPGSFPTVVRKRGLMRVEEIWASAGKDSFGGELSVRP